MHTVITIRMEADTKGELIDTFGSQVENCRNHFELLKEEGVFGPPEKTELRFLIIGGQWRGDTTKDKMPNV